MYDSEIRPTVAANAYVPSEAFAVLFDLAQRKCDEPLAGTLARRALRVTEGTDFAVARDALEALLRRLESAGDVRVARAGDGYRTRRVGRDGKPYEIWIGRDRDGELEGSCSCLDFCKASLGWCKHVLAVAMLPKVRTSAPRALRWNPVRPFRGAEDRLARLWIDPAAGGRIPRGIVGLFQTTNAGRPIEPAALAKGARAETLRALLGACRRDTTLAEPAIVPMLEEALAAETRGLGKVGGRELDRLLRGFKRRLYPYQREGVTKFLGAGRLLLADDMGLGKTAQAIASCHALFQTGKVHRALIVTPASLKAQWEREWRGFTDQPITQVEGTAEQRTEVYRQHTRGALLVNYEQLLRDLPAVLGWAPELVVLDEAQRIKNWETRTASVVKQLAPAWRLVLTGTPMENRLDELASIMEWVDEHALEPRWRLPSWHAVRADGTREVVGARNLETLRARLAPSMLRRVRQDVLAQLPARRDTVIPLPLVPEQQAAHADLDQPIARLVASARTRPLTQPEFLRLMMLLAKQRMICNALALRDFTAVWPELAASRRRTEARVALLGSPKLCDLRDRLVELTVTQGRKVVVFSQWRRMLQLAEWVCGDALAKAGVRAVFFTGQESQRRRAENLVEFHDDPATRVLFASDAGGVGLNLQRAASCCINLELPWNPAVLEQRIGRIHRLGQTQPIEVYNYVALGGIEERIAQLVGDKRALFAGLFDGTSDEVAFDSSGSFLTRVQRLVEPTTSEHARADVEHAELDDAAIDDADLEARLADDEGTGEHGAEPAAQTSRDWTASVEIAREASAHDEAAAVAAAAAVATATAHALEDEHGRARDAAGAVVNAAAVAELVRVLADVQARPLDGGRVALEMPAPAASLLGGLLRTLASALEGTGAASPH